MRNAMVAGVLTAAVATPAMAANYWVVKDLSTQKCSIVQQDQKPASDAGTKVIGTGYASRDAAQYLMTHTMVACGGQD